MPGTADNTLLTAQIRELASALEPIATGQAVRLQPLPDVRAVSFDVYGTLLLSGVGDISLVSRESRGSTFAQLLAEYGWKGEGDEESLSLAFYAEIERQQARQRKAGVDHPEVEIRTVWKAFLESLQADDKLSSLPSDVAIERLSIGFEMAVNPVWPVPGMDEMLAMLARRQWPLGIVSNAQFFTPLLFEAFLNTDLSALGFDPACCTWSYAEGLAKPSRRIYELSAERWKTAHGLAPEQILYVGNDMRNDIWPAASLGFRTALYAGDQRSLRLREEEAGGQPEPDLVLTDYSQLMEVFA